MQGALSIARSSREKLLDQISLLKNNRGNFNPTLPASSATQDERGVDETGADSGEEESNVRMLKASER